MTNYRRNFVRGGCYFFTVNLADRRLALLINDIGLLRAAFRQTRVRHSSRSKAAMVLRDHPYQPASALTPVPGLDPGTHVYLSRPRTWMAGSSPAKGSISGSLV
jgi:hypothetical protein